MKNIKDPSIRDWVIPTFTTTTPTDRIVASISLMSTLQNFFEYKCCLECGIPSVTLLGTLDDWLMLSDKVNRLLEFNVAPANDMTKWVDYLRPLCDNLVNSFKGEGDIHFWDNICMDLGGGSGPSFMSGWCTVFSVFKATGEWQGNNTYEDPFNPIEVMDWPVIDMEDLSSGLCKVPILVDDNGAEYNC